MRLPRFTTLQLLLLTTACALLVCLGTTAFQWTDFTIVDLKPGAADPVPSWNGEFVLRLGETTFISLVPLSRRVTAVLYFVGAFAGWAAVWGVVCKRGRESLAKNELRQLENDPRQRLPTPFAPLAMKVCWGLMVVGGLVAVGIPIVLMFTLGPLLFPTIYFSLFVGLAAIARGAARDSVGLRRTAGLQLANMIALDPANVVFAAMEFALLRSASVREYLGAENR